MSESSEQFYDAMSGEYTDAIRQCVPRYDEMLGGLLAYVPANLQPRNILELGCGTGNLTVLLKVRWPKAEIQAVDISGECTRENRNRMDDESVCYVQSDMRKLEYAANSFDLVCSSISLHHLVDDDKARMFGNIKSWLRPEGTLAFSDQMRGETDAIYAQHLQGWKIHAEAAGVSPAEWQNWMQHQEQHDYHATLAQHYQWLNDAGFANIDCPWRYLLWTIIVAQAG